MAAVWEALDQDAAAIPVTPGQVAPVVLVTLGQDAVATLVTLDQDVHNQEAPGLDARRSGGHTLDLPEAAVQSLDPLAGKVQLVARFPVGGRWGELLTLAVLVVLDQDVLADREDLDQDAQAAKANLDQDDDRDDQIQPREERCNTKFLF